MFGTCVNSLLSGELSLNGAKSKADSEKALQQLRDAVLSLLGLENERLRQQQNANRTKSRRNLHIRRSVTVQNEILRKTEQVCSIISSWIDKSVFSECSNKTILEQRISDGVGTENQKSEPPLVQHQRNQLLEKTKSKDKGLLLVSDLKKYFSRFHCIWFDAHADFNTDQTSETKNFHGMPGAAACGLGNC